MPFQYRLLVCNRTARVDIPLNFRIPLSFQHRQLSHHSATSNSPPTHHAYRLTIAWHCRWYAASANIYNSPTTRSHEHSPPTHHHSTSAFQARFAESAPCCFAWVSQLNVAWSLSWVCASGSEKCGRIKQGDFNARPCGQLQPS